MSCALQRAEKAGRPWKARVLLAWLVLPGVLWAAAPQVLRTPGYGAPVRGGPGDLLMIPGYGFRPTDQVVYEVASAHAQPGTHPPRVPASDSATLGRASVPSSSRCDVTLGGICLSTLSFITIQSGHWSAPQSDSLTTTPSIREVQRQ